MKVNREEFLRVLERVQAGLSPRPTADQCQSFNLVDGYAVASDRQKVWCRCPSGLVDRIKVSVQAKPLMTQLRAVADEFIGLDLKDNNLVITCGEADRIRFRTEPPLLNTDLGWTPKTVWRQLDESFSDAVELVRDCAHKDAQRRWIATTVHVHPNFIEACDGNQACRYKLDTGVSSACVVEAEVFREVVGAGLTELTDSLDGETEDPWLHMRSPDGLNMSFRRYAEAYPPMGVHYRLEGDKLTLPKSLAEAIGMAETFSKEDRDANRVLVMLADDEVAVTGTGSAGDATFVRPCEYSGQPLTFFAPVPVLKSVLERSAECLITKSRLMIDGGRWRFVASLVPYEEKK